MDRPGETCLAKGAHIMEMKLEVGVARAAVQILLDVFVPLFLSCVCREDPLIAMTYFEDSQGLPLWDASGENSRRKSEQTPLLLFHQISRHHNFGVTYPVPYLYLQTLSP